MPRDGSVGPFWRYFGAKWRAAPKYPPPTEGIIVEPFAGAAGYACRYPDRDVLLIDASPTICGIWEWLVRADQEEVMAIPAVPDGGTVDDIEAPRPARDLVGFWCNPGCASPRKTPTRWMRGDSVGWARARVRIAAWLPKIRHWQVSHGDYSVAPDVSATWFVDPPYQVMGRHYPYSDVDYAHLAGWCASRRGQVIVCEQAGADWLPWNHSVTVAGKHTESHEVAWVKVTDTQP